MSKDKTKDAADQDVKKGAKTARREKELEKAAEKYAGKDKDGKRDFSYTQNREISWLRFDDRILDEAYDPDVPIFERLKFCEIVESNLDEWFMIRVGGLSDLASLKNQPRDNKSNQTPAEQLDGIFDALPVLVERHERGLAEVESLLAEKGLVRVSPAEYTDEDRSAVRRHFERRLAPIISPLIVDPRHPFPNLRNGRLFVACSLDKRIRAAAPWIPFLSDYPDYFKIVHWPAEVIFKKQQETGISNRDLYKMLSYFDVKNFTRRITCPILMGVGLQDPTCPPHTNFAGYNLISSQKQFVIYPECGHDTRHPDWDDRQRDFFRKITEM